MTLIDAELSGPINGILAVSELLQRLPVPGEAVDHVRSIHEQAQSLLSVVQDARELAGISKPARPETTVLRTFVDGLEASWAARTALDGVTLMVGYEGDTELAAEIDAERLRRVFDNLIGNALKFAREGMVEARLKAQVVGSMIHISARVRDDGPRVGAQNLSRFFETPDSIDDGFSLSVCRRLVEALDGRIWAEINAGRGTTINFELHAPRSQLLLEPVSQSMALRLPILETKPHILIVDDNATNRVVAQALCEMFGCSCEAAEDGLEALEAVQARHFDLILMDIKMPRLDGVQATLAIRALEPPVSLMPIIALTANADPVDAASYIASGMASVVEKPIKPERLRAAMNAALVAHATDPRAEGPALSERRVA
jgi:CheY-like chemotaxis protein